MSKSIATCPTCRNTGALDERYCECEAGMALRARIDNDPAMQAKRAEIDRLPFEQGAFFVSREDMYRKVRW